eukprot:3022606-Pleurochrysis_carterae.AAC.1
MQNTTATATTATATASAAAATTTTTRAAAVTIAVRAPHVRQRASCLSENDAEVALARVQVVRHEHVEERRPEDTEAREQRRDRQRAVELLDKAHLHRVCGRCLPEREPEQRPALGRAACERATVGVVGTGKYVDPSAAA